MSVKVHEAFSIDSFQDRLMWWDDFLGDQLKDEWRVNGVGTAVVVDAQTGGIVRITTGGADDDAVRIDWTDVRTLHVNNKLTVEYRLKLSATTNINPILRLFFDGTNLIAFYFDTDAAHTNWRIQSVDGATTDADTGIAFDADYHIFRIECFPAGEVHFYIDGVETANSPITTNIPDDAADFLQPWLFIRTRENATKSMDIDYVVVRQER